MAMDGDTLGQEIADALGIIDAETIAKWKTISNIQINHITGQSNISSDSPYGCTAGGVTGIINSSIT